MEQSTEQIWSNKHIEGKQCVFSHSCGFINAVLSPKIPFPTLFASYVFLIFKTSALPHQNHSHPLTSHPLIDLYALYIHQTWHCTVNRLITLANDGHISKELLLKCFQSKMILLVSFFSKYFKNEQFTWQVKMMKNFPIHV